MLLSLSVSMCGLILILLFSLVFKETDLCLQPASHNLTLEERVRCILLAYLHVVAILLVLLLAAAALMMMYDNTDGH